MTTSTKEPTIKLSNGTIMPSLAFGLYKVTSPQVIRDALAAGYRHFDSAPIYGNEALVGQVLHQESTPRGELFLTSKVWNDAVKSGRVRESVEKSIDQLQCEYLDLCLIHWPVPGHFVDAYRVLEELHREGKIRAIGLSNFAPRDYEELVSSGITVPPSVNQIEASVVMYRKDHIDFFQAKNIVVYAHKTLNRASCLDRPEIANLASKYKVTGAQIMIRWCFQKGLAMAVKSNNLSRMRENREISHFLITEEDMESLDSLTTPEDITARTELEDLRKHSL